MSDEEFEDRLRSLGTRRPSPDLDRRIAETVRERHTAPSPGHWWRMAAVLLAGTLLGYGAGRIEAARSTPKPEASPSVRVYIVPGDPGGRSMLDFSPAASTFPAELPVVHTVVHRPSDI